MSAHIHISMMKSVFSVSHQPSSSWRSSRSHALFIVLWEFLKAASCMWIFPAFLTVKVIFGDSWPTSNCCSSSAPAAGSGSPTLFSSCFWSFLSPHSSSSSSPSSSSSSSTFCSFLFHSFSAERRRVMERREEERRQGNGEMNTWQEAGIIRI